ncbi:MAG: rod-binding protein [Symbiobacteriia bacterium]
MSVGPSAIGGPKPPGPTAVTSQNKLLQACRDFESLFLQQIMQEARQGVAAMSSEPRSFDRQVYEGWQDEQFAHSISGGGGIGLAATLYRQLSATLTPAPAAVDPKPGK